MEYVLNVLQVLSIVLNIKFVSNVPLDQPMILLLIAVNYPLIQVPHVNWEQLLSIMLVNAHLEHSKVNPNVFHVNLHTNGMQLLMNAYHA